MPHRRIPGRRWLVAAAAVAAALAGPGAALATTTVSSAGAEDLSRVALSIGRGGSLRIENTTLDGRAAVTALDLARFEVATAATRFVLQTDTGARIVNPDLPVYLRGSADGMPGSVVVMSVRATGEIRGVISSSEGTWLVGRNTGAVGRNAGAIGRKAAIIDTLRTRRVDRQAFAAARSFHCDVLDNPMPRLSSLPSSDRAAGSAPRSPATHTAQIAVELDYDYYLTFAPDADAAILYALDLMAFVGVLGDSEIAMNVQVPFVQLWTTAHDPYSRGSERLGQLRDRWNQVGFTNCAGSDCTTLPRSTVILLSSAPTGGVAYLPGLCDWWHSPTGGYSYAYTGSIGGEFDIAHPGAVWDIVATAHELGHNFGSMHTHCFSPPIDECYGSETGCYAGATSLPAGCPGDGQGCGTIMSYCHLLPGGTDNISLTYGAGHPWGDAPDRVPAAMMSEIATEAAAAPDCLTASGGMVELSIGNAGSGSGTVRASPSTIACGKSCHAWMNAGSVVTLAAVAGPFSTFTGWSGDADCSDGTVTLTAAAHCVATFEGSCGAGASDCDDGDPCTSDACVLADHCENTPSPRDASSCYAAKNSRLTINAAPDPSKNRMLWQWSSGDAFAQADLGDPSASTDYTLCVYDTTLGEARVATSMTLAAGSPFWRSYAPLGWTMTDNGGSIDGIRKLQIKTGSLGKTRVKLTARGAGLPLPAAVSAAEFFDEDPAVTVQMVTSDNHCWSTSFTAAGTTGNTPASFRASGH